MPASLFRTTVLLAASFALAACATQSRGNGDLLADMFAPVGEGKIRSVEAAAAAAGHPLGSASNPVRASMPPGQRAYLARLRCSDGSPPAYQRGGSVGTGPYGKIMDVYELKCAAGQPATAAVYMDMYHNHVEDRPVPGFTIVAP